MKDFDLIELNNGIRIVHKQVPHTKIAHCGFVLNIGSRDEKPHQQGIAHFWEHMAFKGTQNRKAFHILNRLDAVGGDLNAYTTKEKICFHASVLDAHFDKAVDLLTDITFRSTFPEKEIQKEKNVILEEMAMYNDVPEDAIQDEFDELLFPEDQLGKNILGNTASVKGFTQDDFFNFIDENLDTDEVVFSSVSNLPSEKVFKLLRKHLENIPSKRSTRKRLYNNQYKPLLIEKTKDISQVHCAMGVPAIGIGHPDRMKLFLLNNLLGGPNLNSRLNMSLREKYGYVYNIESSFTPFIDTGIFAIFFAVEPNLKKKSLSLVKKELNRLKKEKLSGLQLQRLKNQIIGQMAMSEENNLSMMIMLAKSLLDLNKIDSFENVVGQINQISSEDLFEMANIYFQEDHFSYLIYNTEQ
ncbi:M16 family metallopeptidase [Aureibacter tunicatorum]|uniref:Zn-dependent peptidase n=1 Tax=Aureibacter tunicatorum TaxID=866807 RepID=A0AAE3XNX3_9BACT|nr:pitrilysin family protein [Aureibacter tunicatorum]MDR6240033.1 putative Zn-dependent peptidase [Aureibacter tunicatorum]